jgi:hypothetical protein
MEGLLIEFGLSKPIFMLSTPPKVNFKGKKRNRGSEVSKKAHTMNINHH